MVLVIFITHKAQVARRTKGLVTLVDQRERCPVALFLRELDGRLVFLRFDAEVLNFPRLAPAPRTRRETF